MEPEALGLLEDYGIPAPRYRFIQTESEAFEAAKALGWPVVMKVVSPDILHKTDLGGVILGIQNDSQMRDAFSHLTSFSGKRIEGVLVCPFQQHEIELSAGMVRDPQFGPVITFGLGGIWIEVFRDIAYGIAPLSPQEAEEMIHSIRTYSILMGVRGKEPADMQALCDLLVRLSRMALEETSIQEMDLNPIFPLQKGYFIADVRVIL